MSRAEDVPSRWSARIEDDGVLFVLGVARSGTTFVNGLLEEWFDFGMGPEGSFVPRYARRVRRYGPLDRAANLRRLVDDVCASETLEIPRTAYPEGARFDVSPERVLERVREPTYAGVVRAVFECMAVLQECTRVGNKLPAYWRHLDLLESLFGERAHYLHVVRDGRDVALSTMRMPWGERSSYACARHWDAAQRTVEGFARRVRSDRLITLRYEDLLGSPLDSVQGLEAFLGIRLSDARREQLVAELEANPKRAVPEPWAARLSAEDQRIYEAVAGERLRALDYRTCHSGATTSWHERARFRAGEMARRAGATLGSLARLIR